jgi:tetratricopeptide (TPR) repeat protein
MRADYSSSTGNPFMSAPPRPFAGACLFLLLSAMLLLSGCSLPRIIVLHDPLSSDDHLRLGSIYASQGKTELARDQYRMAVDVDKKNGRAWQLLGDLSYKLKDYREAERAYDKALGLDPKSGDLHNNLAWVYVQQDRKLGKAKDLTMKAMDLSPEHRPYYLDTLGVILLKRGEVKEAIAALKDAVDTLPKDQPDLLSEAYLHLADAYKAAGDEAGAEVAIKRSQELSQKPH